MRHPNLLRKDDAVLVIVDIQTKLLNVMFEREGLISGCSKLIQSAKLLGIPMIMTEQYPEGMGSTDPAILKLLPETKALAKMSFSCCGVGDFDQKIKSLGKKQMVIIGIESHICVLQTAHDLLHQGYLIYVPYDAVSSRKEGEYRNSLDRMRQAGAVVGSVESAIFEMMKTAEISVFKQISRIIK